MQMCEQQFNRLSLLFSLLVLLTAGASFSRAQTKPAIEPWADSTLPVKEGLALWADTSKQFDAWAAHDRVLIAQEPVDVLYDASGNKRHLTQAMKDAQPIVIGTERSAAIRFDGENDCLRWNGPDLDLSHTTVFIVASMRSNTGGFRAFVSAGDNGKNDFSTGFNIDLGPPAAGGMHGTDYLNVEGKGFVGATNLLKGHIQIEELRQFTVSITGGEGNVRAYLDGELTGQRDRRDNGRISVNNLVLGARLLSNEDTPPYLRSQLHGDIAEVLIYNRVLTDEERKSVDAYLQKKYDAGLEAITRAVIGGKPLERVKNPPAVQMFIPGFVTHELPVELTNINNLRYRPDGKLLAVAYDGNVYLLSDSDGDGLEDKVEVFWKNEDQITAPIGAALTPPGYEHGDGLFIACKSKLSLIVDTNGDDVADTEIVAASGWPPTFSPVDALGVAVAKDGSVYFGLGCANFVDAYQRDEQGKPHYRLDNERGTILKLSPDFKNREIVCTGIRFPVGLAFNAQGDLFCTDQEGATWLPNGNPFDELLHIQPGRHYGFPPRHPRLLPDVVDEPSTFDFMPQHQSTCGLVFNDGVHGGPHFGPASWSGDALVSGESRGKLWRTALIKTETGYVAQTHLIASLSMLTIDSCVSPTGDLVVTVHTGNPDWGTGPKGKGKLYKIRYRNQELPQPVHCYPAGPGEIRVAFDRPVDIKSIAGWAEKANIDYGRHVAAGDRFENIRPGYAVVKRQMNEPRHDVPVGSIQVTPDGRTLTIGTAPQTQAAHYALTLPGFIRPPASDGEIQQTAEIDLGYDLSGVEATWQSEDGEQTWRGWLPHPDLAIARAFTAESAEHEALWSKTRSAGTLTLRTKLNLMNLMQPAVQPGSILDYTPEPEQVRVHLRSPQPIRVTLAGKALEPRHDGDRSRVDLPITVSENDWPLVEIQLPTGETAGLTISFTSSLSDTERPLAIRRFLVPWASPMLQDGEAPAGTEEIPQLAGGDWIRGRDIFFSNQAACYKCHTLDGSGSDLGPDLSNLIHRDYESVLRDIQDPSGALNPDFTASIVQLNDGQVLSGIVRDVDAGHLIVRGDLEGEKYPIARDAVKSITPAKLSIMPSGIPEGLGEEKMRDLLTFLLTEPLQPAPIERKGAPPPRSRGEVDAVLNAADSPLAASRPAVSTSQAPLKPIRILLVASAKDHGVNEHDYPLWQQRWSKLLAMAPNLTIDTAMDWPSPEQWESSDVVVNFSANPGWTEARGKDLDAFFARGGGLVLLHWAVHGHDAPEAYAKRIGLASKPGIGFRHGPVDLTFRDAEHAITRGFTQLQLIDETYWKMAGDESRIHVLADAVEEGRDWPQLWTFNPGEGRVVGSIMGHYTWTFDDPLYRIIVLRSICWAAGEENVNRLNELATIGARVQ